LARPRWRAEPTLSKETHHETESFEPLHMRRRWRGIPGPGRMSRLARRGRRPRRGPRGVVRRRHGPAHRGHRGHVRPDREPSALRPVRLLTDELDVDYRLKHTTTAL